MSSDANQVLRPTQDWDAQAVTRRRFRIRESRPLSITEPIHVNAQHTDRRIAEEVSNSSSSPSQSTARQLQRDNTQSLRNGNGISQQDETIVAIQNGTGARLFPQVQVASVGSSQSPRGVQNLPAPTAETQGGHFGPNEQLVQPTIDPPNPEPIATAVEEQPLDVNLRVRPPPTVTAPALDERSPTFQAAVWTQLSIYFQKYAQFLSGWWWMGVFVPVCVLFIVSIPKLQGFWISKPAVYPLSPNLILCRHWIGETQRVLQDWTGAEHLVELLEELDEGVAIRATHIRRFESELSNNLLPSVESAIRNTACQQLFRHLSTANQTAVFYRNDIRNLSKIGQDVVQVFRSASLEEQEHWRTRSSEIRQRLTVFPARRWYRSFRGIPDIAAPSLDRSDQRLRLECLGKSLHMLDNANRAIQLDVLRFEDLAYGLHDLAKTFNLAYCGAAGGCGGRTQRPCQDSDVGGMDIGLRELVDAFQKHFASTP